MLSCRCGGYIIAKGYGIYMNDVLEYCAYPSRVTVSKHTVACIKRPSRHFRHLIFVLFRPPAWPLRSTRVVKGRIETLGIDRSITP